MIVGRKILLGLMCTTFVVACDSKRVQKDVDGVSGGKATYEETKKYSIKVNDEIEKYDRGLKRISLIVKRIEEYLNVTKSSDQYTLLDLYSDIVNGSDKGLGDRSDSSYVRHGVVILDKMRADNPCRKIETLVEAENNLSDQKDLSKISIKAKLCPNEFSYATLFEANYTRAESEVTTKVEINLDPLNAFMNNGWKNEVPSKCFIVHSNNGNNLDSVVCQNVPFRFSSTESAVISDLVYRSSDAVMLSAVIFVTKDGETEPKKKIVVKLSNSWEVIEQSVQDLTQAKE